MDSPIIEAEGMNGTVHLYNDHVEITADRFLETLRPSTKTTTIERENIATIEFNDAGHLQNGTIKILPHNVASNNVLTNLKPYTINFLPLKREEFHELHEHLTSN